MKALQSQERSDKILHKLTLRIPQELNIQIKEMAEETGLSKNAVLKKLIQISLENHK